MIDSILFNETLKDNKRFDYALNLPFFKEHTTLKFTDGLNILFSPNGTGKSTILKMLGQATASEQGGHSTITNTWISDVNRRGHAKGFTVIHDGQPVIYCNPRDTIGLIGGGAGFDDDFFTEGMQNLMLKESTGGETITKLVTAFSIMAGKNDFPTVIGNKTSYQTEEVPVLKASIPKHKPTLIFDEPESGLATFLQANLFKKLEEASANFQIIVATHSVFSIGCSANFIELDNDLLRGKKSYREVTKEFLLNLMIDSA